MDISYDIFVNNDEERANSLNFSYDVGETGSFTSVGSADFTSTEASDMDGFTSTSRSFTISGLSFTSGSNIILRWAGDDVSGSGSRDEFGLDNISVSVPASPADEDFDDEGLVNESSITSLAAGDWTFTAASAVTMVISTNSEGGNVLNADGGPTDRSIGLNVTAASVSTFGFESTSGTNFDLVTFDLGSTGGATSVTITGRSDNSDVTTPEVVDLTSSDATGSITYAKGANNGGVLTFDSDFDNIDEIVLVFSGAVNPAIDNIDVGVAIVAPITWTGSTDSDWATGTNWDGGSVPTATDNVIIASASTNPVINEDITINDLTINSGGSLTMSSGNLQANGDFVNNGGFQVNSGASFVLMGSRTGSGTEFLLRNLNGNAALSIVGLGFSDATISDFSADFVFGYDNSSSSFTTPAGTDAITPGTGFFVGSNSSTYTINTSGSLNSGNVNVAVTFNSTPGDAFNLLSNPYAAAIDAEDFFTANSSVLTGTAYLWNDGANNSGGARQGNYITVNSLGAAGGPENPSNTPGSGTTSKSSTNFNGSFNSLQGFFVEASTAGTVSFTPSMQITGDNFDMNFFRQASSRNTLRLSVSNEEVSDNLLVVLDENASLGADFSMDGTKFSGNSDISFYASQLGNQYAISALPLIANEAITLPLGLSLSEAGTYTISVDEFDNFPEDVIVRLHDALTNQSYDLGGTSSINFETERIVDGDRFSLSFSPARQEVVTAIDSELSEIPLRVYGTAANLTIAQDFVNQTELAIYSISGQSIFQKNVRFNNGELNLTGLALSSNNLYIVRMAGQTVKFIIQ